MKFKVRIEQNTKTINELHQRIHETVKNRDKGSKERKQWKAACREFHESYSELAFPGGVETARDRIRKGDTEAIDYAIDFLVLRPYFFRSGYMYRDFMRILRNCPLSDVQKERYEEIHSRYRAYRRRRQLG